MTVQYCSDLHLEFSQNKKFISKNPLKPAGEILLLAGDIVPFAIMDEQEDFFNWLADNYEQVYWIPGNHEYYGFDIATKNGKLNESIRSNVFLVNNLAVKLDKVQLIFSTLWSEIAPENFLNVRFRMSDFSMIQKGRNLFTPADYNNLHLQCKNFIRNALSIAADVPTFVVTHHVPTFLHYPAKYRKDVLNVAFATELQELIEQSEIAYWLYGHHHYNIPQFNIGKTQLITNQLGYIKFKENSGFKNDACIEFA